MSDDRLDVWLSAAGFEDLDERDIPADRVARVGDVDDVDDVDDPWGALDLDPVRLTDAQRDFVDATSPALGAALAAGTLTGTSPLDELDSEEIERADEDVIDFDDE